MNEMRVYGLMGLPCVPCGRGKRWEKKREKAVERCAVNFKKSGMVKCEQCGEEFVLDVEMDEVLKFEGS